MAVPRQRKLQALLFLSIRKDERLLRVNLDFTQHGEFIRTTAKAGSYNVILHFTLAFACLQLSLLGNFWPPKNINERFHGSDWLI